MQTVAACRLEASRQKQIGTFKEYAAWLLENAKAAERWLVKGGHP